MAVTLLDCHISGSPFPVSVGRLLLKVSSADYLADDWLDPAVAKMSNIQRARLFVRLLDSNGAEVYKGTGVTKCAWSKLHITAPGKQYCDHRHTNAIGLDNGDGMMIMSKSTGLSYRPWSDDLYRNYSITIVEGDDPRTWSSHQRRRMILAPNASNTPGWTTPENRISFANAGFKATINGNWPKFNGTFQIFYQPL